MWPSAMASIDMRTRILHGYSEGLLVVEEYDLAIVRQAETPKLFDARVPYQLRRISMQYEVSSCRSSPLDLLDKYGD